MNIQRVLLPSLALLIGLAIAETGGATPSTSSPPWAYADAYTGPLVSGYGDVIASNAEKHWFDILGANVSWGVGILQVDIFTAFAESNSGLGSHKDLTDPVVTKEPKQGDYPQIGDNQWLAGGSGSKKFGIGAGDLFLSVGGWNENGGNIWNYALSLDNRWSAVGGAARLYALPTPNAAAILTSDAFMSGGIYRNGQAVAIDRSAQNVTLQSAPGSWTPTQENGHSLIRFLIDTTGTDLSPGADLGIRWTMACANDIIEFGVPATAIPPTGAPDPLPVPAPLALLLPGLLWLSLRSSTLRAGREPV